MIDMRSSIHLHEVRILIHWERGMRWRMTRTTWATIAIDIERMQVELK